MFSRTSGASSENQCMLFSCRLGTLTGRRLIPRRPQWLHVRGERARL
jgi:hypothetical protein